MVLRRVQRWLACACLGIVLTGAVPARGAETHPVVTLGYNYVPPVAVEIHQGDAMTLTNLDLEFHTLTSDEPGRFGTGPDFVEFLETRPVEGVSALPPGDYTFHCEVHPALPTMHGVLRVLSPEGAQA